MKKKFVSKQAVRVEITAAQTEGGRLYDLETTAAFSNTHPDLIRRYYGVGLIAAQESEQDELFFDDDAIYWLRQIETLRREGGISQHGLRMIVDLLQEVERLQMELRSRTER
jgi:DNA-binding transcriptional MerR regulator